VLAHVTLRLLAESPSWTEEVTIYMMVWIGFLVAPIAYRAGANVSIEFFKAMLGKRTRLILELALSILVLAIISALFWLSFPFIQQGFNRTAQTFDLSAGWLYMCTAYGYFGLITAILELMLREVRALISDEYAGDPVIRHAMVDDLAEAGMTGVNPTPDRLDRES
jgi:TRAP-type C4-dicarboxylate transport system permease small subunit